MDGRGRVQAVLAEFARGIELDGLELDANDSCRLSFDGELLVDIDFDPAGQRVVLSAPLGCPAPGAEAEVCEAALRSNALWQAAEAVVGRDGAGRELVLLRHLAVAELDGAMFEGALARFVEAARGWRGLIREAAPGRAVPAPSGYDGLSIRV